jgi:sirohydrochlorin cobaltochelatase
MIATRDKAPPVRGLILFAHGSREIGWSDPFEKLAARVRALSPGHEVRLAFLELMRPSLGEAVNELVENAVSEIAIVPIFLGQGGHLKRDLPRMIAELRARHSAVKIDLAGAAGEEDGVLDAIARYCVRQLHASANAV